MKRDMQSEYDVDEKWYFDLCDKHCVEKLEVSIKIWIESKWRENDWLKHFNELKKKRD